MSDNTSPYGINPFPSSGVGACTLANSPVDLGQEMIQRRIQNKSWKEIADEFGMPNPSAARAKFQKLTGITDFKIKGKDLKVLVDNDMLATIKGAAVKKVKKSVAAVDSALDAHKALDVLDPKTKKLLTDYGISKDEYDMLVKDLAEAFANPDFSHGKALLHVMNKYPDEFVYKYKFSLISEIGDNMPPPGSILGPPVGTKKSAAHIVEQFNKNNSEWIVNANDEMFSVIETIGSDKYDQAMNMIHGGEQLYSKIKAATGLDFHTIDQIYWNQLVVKQKGNIWDAYKLKPTSETGFNAIKEMVTDLRASGYTVDEIISITGGVQKEVIELIMKGGWKVPEPGSLKIFTGGPSYTPYSSPASVSQTPVIIYETPVQTSFDYMSEAQYRTWHNELEHLTDDQMKAFKSYTGAGYSNLNASLRGGATGGEKARHLSEGMRPLVSDTRVTRFVGTDAFPGNMNDLGGTVYTDKGFMSTAVTEGGTYGRGRPIKMIMDLPAGTKSRYVDTFSSNSGEKELLLDKNLSFMVTRVVQKGNHWEVYMKALV